MSKRKQKFSNGQNASFNRKVKAIRRVARLAAEYAMTAEDPTDENINAVAIANHGEDTVQARVFAATAKLLVEAKYGA